MKKHLVILTPGFPENEEDSTCIPALQIFVKELVKTNAINVSVITLYYPNKRTSHNWNGIKVTALALPQNKLHKIASLFTTWKQLKQIHKDNPIDSIHSFWLGECAFLGHYFSKKNNLNHVITLMGQDANNKSIFSRFLPLKKIDLVTLSNFHQQTLLNNFKVPSKIIPWGIHAEITENNTSEKTIDIIGIGSLIPLKKYSLFLDIIRNLKLEYPDINAIIIGDGKEKKALLMQIKTLQLEKNIKLLGALSYPKTQKLLSKSKVLLHTSNYESFGMVFAEALAVKTPIVSRPVGIASKSDFWYLGNTKEELIIACKKMLLKNTYEETKSYNISDTVNAYLKLYHV